MKKKPENHTGQLEADYWGYRATPPNIPTIIHSRRDNLPPYDDVDIIVLGYDQGAWPVYYDVTPAFIA